MKKIKIGISFVLLILACLIIKNGLVLINYLSALILHELAHLWVATKRGYKLKMIKLDMFGMSVDLGEKVDDKDLFSINLAGPLFNLLLCVLCLASYWIFPKAYFYLNNFCLANLILAMFNLLPIYPLDGGKMFKGMFKSSKAHKTFDTVVRIVLIVLFGVVFCVSLKYKPNWFCLLFIAFLVVSFSKKQPNFSLFKNNSKKQFEKVVMLKIDKTETLFNALKKINNRHFTIFYFKTSKYNFVDEDLLINLATRFPLTSRIGEIVE